MTHSAMVAPTGAEKRIDMNRYRQRFWARVAVGVDSECWPWTGLIANGYGMISTWLSGRRINIGAHRFAYTDLVGIIPDGLTIDHLCRNTRCCNPAHMEPVTIHENVMRGNSPFAVKARQTECHRGHALSGENLYVTPDGRRKCRTCRRADNRLRRAKLRAT